MLKLEIPDRLKVEFATVEALWGSGAQTRRVDALLLSWVKYEKQLRRLFSFFVFQHPGFTEKNLEPVISAFAESPNLNPGTFMAGIERLGLRPVKDVLGPQHEALWAEMKQIRKTRNKLMHGQVTGKSIPSHQLEKDVKHIVSWVAALAEGSQVAYGYDGLRRNTYISAKSSAQIAVEKYPFTTPAELKKWLSELK